MPPDGRYTGDMTLVHTALSARIAALRHAAGETWPASSSFAPHDVLVDGTSLAALAQHGTTPLVHVPACADPGRVGRLWEASTRCVVLARVEDAVPRLAGHPRQVWIDADLDACSAVIEEARLVGRVSTAHPRRFTVHPAPGRTGRFARLPGDVRRDDVLAIPCPGVLSARDLER